MRDGTADAARRAGDEDAVTRALTLLSCLATEPGAGGILFLGLDPELLPPLGAWLAAHTGTGGAVRTLGSWLGEEDLWLRPRLGDDGFRLVPGLLVEEPGAAPPVVLVPDLCQAGPAVVRAAVTLLGADAAHVEMHGHSLRWHPRAHWLAAADRTEAARLSPHLLDRFPLRVEAEHLNEALWRLGTDRFWDLPAEREALVAALPAFPYVPGTGRRPLPTPEALDLAVGLVPPDTGMRRGLGLARIARALAARAGAEGEAVAEAAGPEAEAQAAAEAEQRKPDGHRAEAPSALQRPGVQAPPASQHPRVEAHHVTEAAVLLGITPPPPRPDLRPETPPAAPSHVPESAEAQPTPTAALPTPVPVAAPAPPQPLPAAPVTPPATAPPYPYPNSDPYPEDSPDALPQLGSLRPPGRRRSAARRLQGRPVGTMRANDVHDLALVPSMIQAATSRLLQPEHPEHPESAAHAEHQEQPTHPEHPNRPLALRAVDLRQYRRRPEPAHALVLVLDHSCRDWDPAPALAPHLRWAYETNAAVTVVEFGHRTAELDLCAERVRVPSLLDPAVLDTFDREPGTASPLAHALDLGIHELRRFLRRGRAVVDEALLVVVTDGRGNVPLDASLRGRTPSGVRREGVTDALRVAATASTLNRLRAVVVAPDLDQYAELPAQLAEALGAALVVAPRRRPAELP
ncbi:hypothetical protein [Streptomyces sp. NPDC001401]|uniref:hypothetical protein n=1 Tax=Streptomyces sp. NPDC001401 TaxID=3364570 RepID=UPI003691748D